MLIFLETLRNWIARYKNDLKRTWITLAIVCPFCGHEWVGIARLGARGIECPKCKAFDPGFNWLEASMEVEG